MTERCVDCGAEGYVFEDKDGETRCVEHMLVLKRAKVPCVHEKEYGTCPRCDDQRDDTCWFCGEVMEGEGPVIGFSAVHPECKAMAEKYLSDTM